MKRWLSRSIALAAMLALVAYAAYRGEHRGNDFKYPYRAAELLRQTGGLRVDAQPRYPITLHAMMAPLTRLPIGQAAAIWAFASVAAVATLPRAFDRLAGISPRRQVPAWLLAGPFFIDAVGLGQGDPINIALVAWGIVAAKEGKTFIASSMIGVAGLIKILPLAHWGTVLSRRRTMGVFLGIAATLGGGFGLVGVAVGPRAAFAGFREQARWIAENEKPWHLVARGGDLRVNNESLPIALARTFGAMPDRSSFRGAWNLERLPLDLIWTTWGLVLGTLVAAFLATIRAAGRIEPGRGWLAMFALGSIVMLASTPICWHHYFLWTLPATVFLADRRRLVLGLAALSIVVTAIPPLRGLGCHMAMAIGIGVLVILDVRREARHYPPSPSGNPTNSGGTRSVSQTPFSDR